MQKWGAIMSGFISLLFSAVLQLFLFSIIPLIWWLITDRKTSFFTWIGLKKPVLKIKAAKLCLIIIGACVIYTLAMIGIMNTLFDPDKTANSQFSGQGIGALPKILVYAVIQTGLSEEIFFRGFLCKRLANKIGFIPANTIQSLCFGLAHGIPFGLVSGNVLVLIICTILPGALGYVQGWMNEKCAGGSIVTSWILHSAMNILSALSSAVL